MKVKQLLTCLLILWGSIAAHAYDFELNGVYYNITDADSKTVEVTYVETGEGNADFYYGTVTIPNRISKDGVTYLVTAIGDDAFHYCANLTSVTLGNNVTRIDSRAFDGCTGLTEIVIPNSVTRIEKEAFSGCSSLASVTLPSQLVSMDNAAFQLCTSLTSIAIPESVTTIGAHAFQNCSKLASVNIPEGVTVINEYLFCGCEALTSIEIPSGVTSIGQLAFNQSGLTSVVIPDGVTTIGNNAFWGCRNMTSASIPASVSSIGNDAFANCSALTSVTLPAGLNTLGGSAFSDCIHLEYVVLCCSPFAIDASAFANTYCPFYVPTESVDTYKTTAGWSEYADRITAATGWTFDAPVPCGDGTANLTFKVTNSNPWEVEVSASPEDIAGALTIPATIENNGLQFAVKGIGDNAFNTRPNLVSVVVPESVKTIGGSAFAWNTGLTSVIFNGDLNTIWGNVFWGSTALEEVQFNGNVSVIPGNCFRGCTSLKAINLPEGLTRIDESAFRESGLESIKFPSTLTEIGENAFHTCSSLKTIDFNDASISLNAQVFWGCTSLEEVYIPKNVKHTGWNLFWGCTSLKTVVFEAKEDNNGWEPIYIFNGCTALESVVVPFTSMMGEGWFSGCSSLKTVTFLRDDAPTNNSRNYAKNFQGVPDDVLFIIPEGTAKNFLLRGYKNLSDKSGLPLVREEFEAEAARIATMADAASNGDKASLTAAVNAARPTVNSTDDYMTVYAQIAAIKTAAKTFMTTATLPENLDVTAATITNPDFDRFDIGWKVPYIGHQIGYQVGSFNGISQLDIEVPLPEAQPVTVGTECYIMNVGTKLFLGKGEAWGTQSIANPTGLKYILKNQRDDNGKIGFLGPNNDGLDADGNEITQLPEGQYWLYSPDISLSDRHSTDRWRDGTCGEGYRCSFTDQQDWDERGVWQLATASGNIFTMQVPQGLPNYQDFQNKYVEGEYAGIWPEHGSDWAASNSNGFSYGLYSDIVYADHPDACQFYCVSVAHHDAYLLKQEMIEVVGKAHANGIDISNALALIANPNATVEELQAEYNSLLVEGKDHFIEAWQGSPTPVSNGQISQTIKKLPAGVYRLEADMIATLQSASAEVTGVNLFAGNAKVPVATDNGKPQHFSVKFENATTRDVTIGIDVSGTNANWVAMDNVRLIYESKAAAIPESAELKSSETDTLYLYNVDADKYLSAGHAWGGHAILDETGLPIRLTQNEETGLWQIYFWEGAADQKLLWQEDIEHGEEQYKNRDTWVDYHGDRGKVWWNITQAGDGTLLIQVEGAADDEYLGNDPGKQDYREGYNGYTYTDVNAYVSADKNVHWILFSKAACDMIIAKRKLMDAILRMEASGMTDGATLLSTAKAVYENDDATIKEVIDITTLLNSQMGMPKLNAPVDMTALITNPRFEENTTEGWSGANAVGGRSDATSNQEQEFFEKDFNMYQVITGVPNGRYMLKWKGFHRPGQSETVYNEYIAGTNNASVVVYANEVQKTMKHIASEMSETQLNGGDREFGGKYFPNNMEGTRLYFDAGFYADQLEVEVTDNVLTIGIKNTQPMSTNHWVIFSDFELYIMENEEQMYHKLSAEDVKCVPGVPFTYNINLTNRDEVTAFQFEMTLPEGVSIYEENGQQEVQLTNRGNGHMFSCTKKGEGNTYLFSALSLQSKPFKKNSGALVRMTLQPAEDMQLGDYEIQVTNVELSKPNGMQVLPFDFTTTLTVKEADPGDVNGDGMITVTDAVYVFRYVNGQEMPHFQKKAADVNGDKQISINDAVGIVNMILGTSNASLLPSAKGTEGGARVLKRLNIQKLAEARYY